MVAKVAALDGKRQRGESEEEMRVRIGNELGLKLLKVLSRGAADPSAHRGRRATA